LSRPHIIAVTGASGFVGTAVVDALRRDPAFICRPLYRSLPTSPASDVEAVEIGDLADGPIPPDALRNVDVVIHTAARTHVLHDEANYPHAAYRRVNVDGTMHLAKAAIAAGERRVVFVSSIKVNGERTPIDRPFTEADEPAPEDSYGLTKLEAERELLKLAGDGAIEVGILRSPLVYGPDVKGNLAQLLRLLERGIPLPLAAVRNQRSLVGLDNLVSAIIATATSPGAKARTYLVSDQDDLSTPELITALASGLGRNSRLWPFPPSLLGSAAAVAGRSDQADRLLGSLTVDSSKITLELGWRPTVRSRDGLAAMAGHYARNREA
jgi:nucleoside-diphosphate-sugar epimerase